MRTSNVSWRCAMVIAVALSSARGASASPIAAPPPSGPVPSYLGTGLSSQWVNGTKPTDYEELDKALSFLTSSSFTLDGVGPVSLSNNLEPIGDFRDHGPMPYSVDGLPEADGWYLAGRMTGAWAVRQPGLYTLAIGADDGCRVTVAGTVLLSHPQSQPFRHAGASFLVNEAGLYPITVEYFNGVEEGAVELSFAPGEVAVDVGAPLPTVFALIPLNDLYPPVALDIVDAGASVEGGSEDASMGAAPSDGYGGGGGGVDQAWHGGGCSSGVQSAMPPWLASVFAFLFAVACRRHLGRTVSIDRRGRPGPARR